MKIAAGQKYYDSLRQQRSAQIDEFRSFKVAKVSAVLKNPHPAVAEIVAERKDRFRPAGGSGFIHKLHSAPMDDVTKRMFRILDCLAKTLASEGFSVAPGYLGTLKISLRNGATDLRLRERLRLPLNDHGKPNRNKDPERTGVLLSEGAYSFEESEKVRMEDAIQSILRSVAFDCLVRDEAANVRADQERALEERRAALKVERELERRNSEALERFVEASSRWRRVLDARAFLAEVERLPPTDSVFQGQGRDAWLVQIRAKIDEMDPLKNGLAGLLGEMTSGG